MAQQKTHYQNIIIGFGKGGKTLASWLSGNGQQVAIIEQSNTMYGGSCINIACIPSKSFVNSASKGIPYADAYQIKETLIRGLRKKNYDKIALSPHGTVIDGKARFVGPKTLEVTTESGSYQLTADRIFINTGTRPATAPIKGIEGPRIYNSTTLMDVEERPQKLVIVGGGFVGLEFAATFLKFGAKVILLDHSDRFLPGEDRDIARAIAQDFQTQGMEIISGANVTEFVSGDNNGIVQVHYIKEEAHHTITADGVLVATGRSPQTADLQLEAAGIKTDQKGYIKVNDRLQTTADDTWAIGDVNGGPQFTYISLDDFRIIKNQLSNGPYNSLKLRKVYASSVFILPTYARIGLNESEAKQQELAYKVYTLPAANIPKAGIVQQKEGLLKAIVETGTGKILGCMLYCAAAHELINIIQLAMHANLSYEVLRDNIYTHPTMAEAFNDLFAG